MKIKEGKFVTVVGHADPTDGKGQILYVNPASRSLEPDAQAKPSDDFELVAYDAADQVVQRVRPVLRLPASTPPAGPIHALIQEDIPLVPGMASVALVYQGKEISRFRGGSGGAQTSGLNLAPPPSTAGNRLAASGGAAAAEPGVSYTVMVKREDEPHWHSIAVGKSRPEFELDRNQFPGAKKVKVKVLRTTGFEQDVVSEEDVDLGY
jgi:hypothetical protein